MLLKSRSHHQVTGATRVTRSTKVDTIKIIILCFFLYGCETRSVTLREEHRLRVLYYFHRAFFNKSQITHQRNALYIINIYYI
jgi:hypothetical protein